ncbi:MAG: hypothetical protein JST81_00775 [Bacteroidetes bacterium]|nr:hypothetical protein [Bacteroidota bacterium]
MKAITLKSILIISLSFFQNKMYAQFINWENISNKHKHLLHVNIAGEYGITAGLGYYHLIPVKRFPFWIGGECSIPFGNRLVDDFKVKIGTQIRIVAFNHFQFSARLQGLSRRYQNQLVRLFNFGCDFAGTLGYYRHHWFLGVEAGFDKAIVTNFKHSDWYKRNIYANVKDGWYEPATGGNFYYGLHTGYSMKKVDFTIRAARVLQQDFKSQPLFPFYGQAGVNFRF